MEKPQKNIIATGILVGIVLAGLGLVVRSLRNINLRLSLKLKKDDSATKKY